MSRKKLKIFAGILFVAIILNYRRLIPMPEKQIMRRIYQEEISMRTLKYWNNKEKHTFEDLLERRNAQLQTACQFRESPLKPGNISAKTWQLLSPGEKPRLYFSDKYKVIACAVPKCGSTQWRDALLVLEGDVRKLPRGELEQEAAFRLAMTKRSLWNAFDWKTEKGLQEIDRRLNTYYRIMTSREPLERLVSAYIDKMRTRRIGDQTYAKLSLEIHKKFGSNPHDEKDQATFHEFISHIRSTERKADLDIHWRPIHEICHPCHMRYHHIAKMETITRDSQHVSEKLGIDNELLYPGVPTDINKAHVWRTDYAEYFLNSTREEAMSMYEYYKDDYRLFGYNSPPFLQQNI